MDYGWSLLVCLWETDSNYCTNVASLAAAYPQQAVGIANEVVEAMKFKGKEFQHPEAVMEEFSKRGVVLACIPRGTQQVALLTLGTLEYVANSEDWKKQCTTLVDSRAPSLTAAAQGLGNLNITLTASDRAYNAYYDECRAKRARAAGPPLPTEAADPTPAPDPVPPPEPVPQPPPPSPAPPSPSPTPTTPDTESVLERLKRLLADAEAALEAAQKAAFEASKKLADAKRAEAEASAAAAADPSNQVKQDAAKAARDDRQAAQDAYNAANAEHKKLLREWADRHSKYQHQKDVQEELEGEEAIWARMSGRIFKDTGLEYFLDKVEQYYGPLRDYFRDKNKDCLDTECGALTCHAEAQLRTFRDVVRQWDRKPCSETAIPAPGSEERCFSVTSLNGNVLSDAEARAIGRRFCEERQKIEGDQEISRCEKVRLLEVLPFNLDPCNSPETMCAPEQGDKSKSKLLPIRSDPEASKLKPYSVHPDFWINPTAPAPPPGR